MMTPPAATTFRWRRHWPVWLIGLAAIVRALSFLGPMLVRQDLFEGDAAQHTWWMYRFADPSLFPNSLAATYFSQWFLSPLGYQTIVGTLCRVFDAQVVVESIAVLLALGAIGLTVLLGRHIGGAIGAAAALVVLLISHCEALVSGGFPRSFGLVLLLGGMNVIVRKQWAALGVAILLSAMFYPPIVLNLAAPAAVVTLIELRKHRRLPRSFAVCVLLGLVAGVVLGFSYLRPLPPEIGSAFSYAEIRHMPEWQSTGRFKLFGYSPLRFYFTAPISGLGLPIYTTALLAALLVVTRVRWPGVISPAAWALLFGGLFMWAMAHVFLFRLYLPNRYTMYVLPVFGMMWAASIAKVLQSRWPMWQTPGRAMLVVVVVITIGADASKGSRALYQPSLWVTATGYGATIDYLKRLPADTRVAAHPVDANGIPLRARLDVLMNSEVALPMHRNYQAEMDRRTSDTFDLLYARDWPTIDAIAARDGVSVFVLDKSRLRDPASRPYLEPYRKPNEARIAAARGNGFAMLSPPPERILFTSGDMMVLRVGQKQP